MSNARRYETDRRPFLEVVNDGERNILRIRQATEQGYIECQPDGVCDLAYPESVYRRSRVKDGGRVAGTLMAGEPSQCVFIDYGTVKF